MLSNSKKYKCAIIGIGSYVPDHIMTNFDLEKKIDTSDEWIRTRTGIVERRICAKDETTADLAFNAAKRAIAHAGIKAQDIDLIINATITPNMIFPSTACLVQEKLKAKNAAGFDLSAACTGFVYALTTAKMYVENGFYENVLVIGAEALSKFVDWEDRNTCVLFGDGAGAVIVSRIQDKDKKKGGVLESYLASDGKYADLLNIPGGGSLHPASYKTIEDRLHFLKMKGNEVFKIAVQSMIDGVNKVLEKAGMTFDDIDCFIPHQANIRIIEAIRKRLKIPKDKLYINVDKYGNTSAATVIIALDEIIKKGVVKAGDKVLMVAFGGGFTWGAIIVEVGEKLVKNS